MQQHPNKKQSEKKKSQNGLLTFFIIFHSNQNVEFHFEIMKFTSNQSVKSNLLKN